MRRIFHVAAIAAAALAAAACDKPQSESAYLNSGRSATAAMPGDTPALPPSETTGQSMSSQPQGAGATASQSTAMSDTASPSTAAAPQGTQQPPAPAK